MQIDINETTVKINDIKIFGVKTLKIGKDYFMIKKDNNNLIHFIYHGEAESPYFTVIRIRDGIRLVHDYKYSNFNPSDIVVGYNNKVL